MAAQGGAGYASCQVRVWNCPQVGGPKPALEFPPGGASGPSSPVLASALNLRFIQGRAKVSKHAFIASQLGQVTYLARRLSRYHFVGAGDHPRTSILPPPK